MFGDIVGNKFIMAIILQRADKWRGWSLRTQFFQSQKYFLISTKKEIFSTFQWLYVTFYETFMTRLGGINRN